MRLFWGRGSHPGGVASHPRGVASLSGSSHPGGLQAGGEVSALGAWFTGEGRGQRAWAWFPLWGRGLLALSSAPRPLFFRYYFLIIFFSLARDSAVGVAPAVPVGVAPAVPVGVAPAVPVIFPIFWRGFPRGRGLR